MILARESELSVNQMDRVDSFEDLLDYVFTDEDISDSPSMKDYKRMNRVMNVMVRFYVRGEQAKKGQQEEATEQLHKIDGILCQVNLQIKSLAPFPEFHPKRKVVAAFIDYAHHCRPTLSSLKRKRVNC